MFKVTMRRILCLLALSLMVALAAAASIPDTPERRENTLVLEMPTGDDREGKATPEDGGEFEIVVPVARNFSSLQELFRILREDDKEPRATGTPPSYVKGTERNSSEFLIFFADGVTQST